MAKLSLSFSIKIPYCPNKKKQKNKKIQQSAEAQVRH